MTSFLFFPHSKTQTRHVLHSPFIHLYAINDCSFLYVNMIDSIRFLKSQELGKSIRKKSASLDVDRRVIDIEKQPFFNHVYAVCTWISMLPSFCLTHSKRESIQMHSFRWLPTGWKTSKKQLSTSNGTDRPSDQLTDKANKSLLFNSESSHFFKR